MIKKVIKINKKVFVVGPATNYARFIEDATLVDDIKDADVVLFTGGEDVSPKIYGRKAIRQTFANPERDDIEVRVYNMIKPNQLCIGVCRGSQLMCALNGGLLVQDVSGHAIFGTHPIITLEGEIFEITSTHHQMQYPYSLPKDYYDIVAICDSRRSRYYEGLDETEIPALVSNGEPEIVLYHVPGKPKALAIQGHPEVMRPNSPTVEWLNKKINEILKTIKK